MRKRIRKEVMQMGSRGKEFIKDMLLYGAILFGVGYIGDLIKSSGMHSVFKWLLFLVLTVSIGLFCLWLFGGDE